MKAYWVYVTTADAAEAGVIARTVVGERLAACANLLGSVRSLYWWEGRLCEGAETALVLKTSGDRKEALVERVRELHTYDCPCVVCLPIEDGNPGFLEWIERETKA